MKTNILIVGSKGVLGQELVNIFKKDRDYKISAWDKGEVDIIDQKQIDEKIRKLKPSIIINAAAYNAVDKCEDDPKEFELAKKINGKAPGYLARIAHIIGAVLVHYSTDYVFDGLPEIPEPKGCGGACGSCRLHENFQPQIGFNETARPNPISRYGKTKLMGESAVQKYTKDFYIIRLSKLFGKPAQGESAKKSFFAIMLELGRKNNPPTSGVPVVDEETSCFTYAPDLAQKTKEIIESKKPFGIYHIINSDPCTWYGAVLELYDQAGIKTGVVPVSAEEFPRPAKRPYYSVLLNTKLNPLRSYKEALKEYLKTL